MQKNRTRNISLTFRVTGQEKAMIEKRMAQTGMSNLRAYILKMSIDGRVIHVELDSVMEMVRLLSNVSNNINQIARKANGTGNIYARDVAVLQEKIEEIWAQMKVVLQKVSKL